jgi:3-hydroxybutyryl-CoA dehydratase
MIITHATVGDVTTYAKTISESDVYLFAGITGDLSPNHVNEQFMKNSPYGRRIVHGAFLVGLMSTVSTKMQAKSLDLGIATTPVSLGYDGLRFIAPAFFGDTVTVIYTIETIDVERDRTVADMRVINQDGVLLAVGKHITKWVRNQPQSK